MTADRPEDVLYVRDVTHPGGECPLHGTEGDCPCTDTGLLTAKDLDAMTAAPRVPHCPHCGSPLYDGSSCPDCGHTP